MKDFQDRLKLDNSQRKEVQRYLGSLTVLSEEVVLKLVRKLKQLEQKMENLKYAN